MRVWEFDIQDSVPFFPEFRVNVKVKSVRAVLSLLYEADLGNCVCMYERMI
jgi:hypothetical protein